MPGPDSTIEKQLAHAASEFHRQLTGHAPRNATVMLNDDTLVISLHEALTPVEKSLACSEAGAAQVRDFHRQLFIASADELLRYIKAVTGREVRESTAELQSVTGLVTHTFVTGTIVQIFQLANTTDTAASKTRT